MSNIVKQSDQGYTGRFSDKVFSNRFTEKSRLPYFLILFFISPVLAATSAIASFRQRGAALILIIFFGAYGYTMILRPGADSYSLAQDFLNHYVLQTWPGFWNELIGILSLKGSAVAAGEPYFPILAFTISRFTADPSVLFMFAGLVFGYFYIKGVTLLYNESIGKWNLSLVLLFIFFLSWVPIDGINAPRTHTANWVYLCGAFLYLKTENMKYVFLVLMAPLIHFGYVAMILPFFIYFFFRDLKYLYVAVLLVSYFVSGSMNMLEPYLTTTELGEDRVSAYSGDRWDPEVRAERVDDRSFHARYYLVASNYSIQFMFFISIIWSGYISGKYHDRLQNGLGSIAILLLSLANFTTLIPALRGRLVISFCLFALAYLFRLYAKNWEDLKNRHWVLFICTPAILLFLFTKYSIVGDYFDFRMLFSPLVYPFLGDDPVSIKEFIRSLLL